MTLKLGYKASNEQFAPRELLEYGVLAEQNGFDSVFISDHLQPWRHDGGHAPFAMSWLGALGASTERITMGTSVLTPTFRYHPAIVAQSFATLGCLYPGRVVLGLGSGESMNEVPLGLEWPDGKERFARFREAVKLIRELWTGERVTFEGDYYRTDKATIYDRPEQEVPDLVGVLGPGRDPVRRAAGRRLDHHQRQGPGAVHGHVDAGDRRGCREGRSVDGRHRHDDRGQGVLRPRP